MKMSELSIVMYHYVRPIKESKFPGIKGLELDGFKRQLDYFTDNFRDKKKAHPIHGCAFIKKTQILLNLFSF